MLAGTVNDPLATGVPTAGRAGGPPMMLVVVAMGWGGMLEPIGVIVVGGNVLGSCVVELSRTVYADTFAALSICTSCLAM